MLSITCNMGGIPPHFLGIPEIQRPKEGATMSTTQEREQAVERYQTAKAALQAADSHIRRD